MATTLDLATLISLIWGIISVPIYQFIPAKGWPIVLTTYVAPLIVCAGAVFLVDGTTGFTWQKYLVDILTTYGSNQAIFNVGKAAGALKP